jgi:hypothetical protein
MAAATGFDVGELDSRPHLPRGVSTVRDHFDGPSIIEANDRVAFRRFPVTVTRLSVTRC